MKPISNVSYPRPEVGGRVRSDEPCSGTSRVAPPTQKSGPLFFFCHIAGPSREEDRTEAFVCGAPRSGRGSWGRAHQVECSCFFFGQSPGPPWGKKLRHGALLLQHATRL